LAAATIGLATWLPSPTYNIKPFSVRTTIIYDTHLPPVFEVAVTVDTLSLSLSSMESEPSNMPSDTVYIGCCTEIKIFTIHTKPSLSLLTHGIRSNSRGRSCGGSNWRRSGLIRYQSTLHRGPLTANLITVA
jgi:hypothetical protein